jgi:GPI mannosyltransferase 3
MRSHNVSNFHMKRIYVFFIVLAVILHFVAAVYSVGFYHPDEQYQVVEFAAYKVGLVPQKSLMWEYEARARPWFQPMIVSLLLRLFQSAGIRDIFQNLLLLRLCISLLSLLCSVILGLCVLRWIPPGKIRTVTLFAVFFAFFAPMLHARLSAENFSSGLLITVIGLVTLVKTSVLAGSDGRSHVARIVVGLLLGATFLVRYQMATMIVGIIVWLMLVNRIKIFHVLEIGAVFLCMCYVGLFVDRWGYGEWALSLWQNFHAVFFIQTRPSNEIYPWWYYLQLYWQEFAGPIGVALLVLPMLLWFLEPLHILSLATIPFIVFNFLTPHKEARYLFPFIYLSPVMIGISIWKLSTLHKLQFLKTKQFKTFAAIVCIIIFLVNVVLLAVNTVLPQTENVFLLQEIHNHVPAGSTIYWESVSDPFMFCNAIPLSLYYSSKYYPNKIQSFDELKRIVREHSDPVYYWNTGDTVTDESFIQKYCTTVAVDSIIRFIPPQAEMIIIGPQLKDLRRSNVVYRCQSGG